MITNNPRKKKQWISLNAVEDEEMTIGACNSLHNRRIWERRIGVVEKKQNPCLPKIFVPDRVRGNSMTINGSIRIMDI